MITIVFENQKIILVPQKNTTIENTGMKNFIS
jgi:hypothetical protein